MINRRRPVRVKYRRSGRHKKTSRQTGFAPVIVILCLSVICGYATARYIVEPVVNYVPQLEKKVKIVEDEPQVENNPEVRGYALQYGCFSNREAAESTMRGIPVEGLSIMEENNMYKIVGKTYKTKDEAKAELDKLPEGVKAFITDIYGG